MPTRILQGAALTGLALALGAAGGYWLASQPAEPMPDDAMQAASPQTQGEVLYWYDPMYPQQKFDQPGKSPFMDMELVPRYADAAGDSAAVSIDASVTQNLGMRLATATRGAMASSLEVTGSLGFNGRDVAVVQTRAGGFVERVYPLAPEDQVVAGAPLAELLVPEWAQAQEEFLALRGVAEPGLLAAARQRMRLAGMPAALIAQVARSGKPQPLWTVTSPIAGVVQTLEVRAGMTLAAGAPLATINGLRSVWLEAAVPEAQAQGLEPGQAVEVRLPALPGEVLSGRIDSILPQANLDSRTLRLRVELDNADGRLRPGLSAQVRLTRPAEQHVLLVPSEAVIRSGRRALVMLAEDGGRYRPTEVRLGRENGEHSEILEGLQEDQQVVASGQFLLDSEASLRGILGQSLDRPEAPAAQPALHEAEGRVIAIDGQSLTLDHGPFKTLGMPGMTMSFDLADPGLAEGIQADEQVRVGVRETDDGLRIERIERLSSPAHGEHDHQEMQP